MKSMTIFWGLLFSNLALGEPATAPAAGNTILKISAKGTGAPLSKAEITIGAEKSFSDPHGQSVVSIPAAGDGVVVISRKGYERLEIKFDRLRPPGEFNVRLIPAQPDDDEILVTGTRDNSVSRTLVSIDEASKVAPGGDPAQVVKLLPGVQSANSWGGGEVVVQGSGPYDSHYYVDDFEIPFVFHGIGNLSVIPGELMERVDFESAGFGVEYGDATGGIITLRTKNDVPERPKTVVVFNLPFYSGLIDIRPLSETESLSVGVRRSYVDIFLREYLNQRNKHSKDPSTNITLSPYFSDAEIQYLKKRDDGHTKVTLLGAYDGLKLVVPDFFASDSSGLGGINYYTGFANVGVEHEKRLDKNWTYVTTPQIYYYRTTVEVAYLVSVDKGVEKARIPTHLTRRLGQNERIYIGIDPSYTVAKTSVFAPKLDRFDPVNDPEDAPLVKTIDTEKYAELATWAALDQTFGSCTVTPGLRPFYNGQTKKAGIDPRLRARYAINDAHSFKGAVGQYSQSPQPLQASPERGNPDLDFVRAHHYVLGMETKWNPSWSTDFDVYYKTATHIIQSNPLTNYNNDGSLRSHGFEALIRRNLTGRLFGWVSYSYSKTQERPNPGSTWRTATYDQTHVGTLVGNYKFTGTWDVGGRYNYHTGGTYNTVSSAVFNANLDKYAPRPAATDINAGRLPPSNTLTVYATHDFLFDTSKIAMRFGMEQFWFKPQVEEIRYNYNYSKTEKVTNLTSIPFFELRGEF